jgi:hypothetical protein
LARIKRQREELLAGIEAWQWDAIVQQFLEGKLLEAA